MKKRFYNIFITLLTSFLLTNYFTIPAFANNTTTNENEPTIETKAIETYKKSATVECGVYGNVVVSVTFGHNMTTGRIWVDSVSYTKNFNEGYVGVGVHEVYTVPGIDETVTGSLVRVYVRYFQFGVNEWTKSTTIEL